MGYIAYIGHYTGESCIGIRVVDFDPETGEAETLQTVSIENLGRDPKKSCNFLC